MRLALTIYDTDDSKRVLAECLRQLNIDEKQMPIRTTLTHISRAKDRLLTPEAYEAEAGTDFRLSQIAAIYALYQKKLRDANALDFDDIIMRRSDCSPMIRRRASIIRTVSVMFVSTNIRTRTTRSLC